MTLNDKEISSNRKRVYHSPDITRVELDKEISLQMQSVDDNAPDGPDETMNSLYFHNDPYKSNMG